MIGLVRGVVYERTGEELIVDVGGVGYRLLATPRLLATAEPGAEITLHTHLHVREDALVLFGFETRAERDAFEVLRSASGVGPKLALSVLGVHDPTALRRALLDDDLDALTLVPGIGKRTAQKMLVELKARFELPDLEPVSEGPQSPRAEVRSALAGLGYDAEEVREVLVGLPDDAADASVEELLRTALRQLASERVS